MTRAAAAETGKQENGERSKNALLRFLKHQRYEFTTVTPLTHQRVNDRGNKSETLRDAFGWNTPFAEELLPNELFQALRDDNLIVPVDGAWRSLVRAASVGSDLFLHSGYPTTEWDSVFFGPDTYRFCRLIRQMLSGRRAPVGRAIDIGCGTGAGGVAVARGVPCEEIIWSDISERALEFCAANLRQTDIPRRQIVKSDLFADIPGTFDLIVANPPYLNDSLHRAYRHGGGEFGSHLSERIVAESLPLMSPGATLILYTGSAIVDGRDPFRANVEALLADAAASVRWTYEEIDPDVFGEELELPYYQRVERIAAVALVVTKDGDAG